MRMTLETWVKNTWLEKRGSDREEIGRLLALADGRPCSKRGRRLDSQEPCRQNRLAWIPVRRERRRSTAGVYPPGNWFAPPGSNLSSSGGNETAEASGAEGRIGDLASVQAVT